MPAELIAAVFETLGRGGGALAVASMAAVVLLSLTTMARPARARARRAGRFGTGHGLP